MSVRSYHAERNNLGGWQVFDQMGAIAPRPHGFNTERAAVARARDLNRKGEPMSSDVTPAPIGGAMYRHPARRGRWQCETAGPKWVSFRSLDVVAMHGGRFLTFKERREDWPNGWERA